MQAALNFELKLGTLIELIRVSKFAYWLAKK